LNKILLNLLTQFSNKKKPDSSVFAFQDVIKHKFSNISLLNAALMHTSLVSSDVAPFERMEFLGDSVLGLIVAEELFLKYPSHSEGELSKLKSKIVSRKFLAMRAKEYGFNNFIKLSEEAIQSGGKNSVSILGDAMEALICAIYLDGDLEDVRTFILNFILKHVEKKLIKADMRDYKSTLQEYTQGKFQITPVYKIVSEEGPEHEKTFTSEVWINKKLVGTGKGSNKKEAQQSAAKAACNSLEL
jgi:ribonuclease III